MAAKGFGWLLGLAVIVVAVAVGAVVGSPQVADAAPAGIYEVGCPRSEIVPGSIAVTSTSREVGRPSGHTIRFRLCPTGEGRAVASDNDRPVKIGLRWRKGQFLLDTPTQAGILLRRGDYAWQSNAAEDISGVNYAVYPPAEFSGVVFPFPPDDLIETGASPDWQFDIPSAARMLNPRLPGESGLQVVFFYRPGSYCREYAREVPLTILPRPNTGGVLRLDQGVVTPGTKIVVQGSGFPPLAPLQSIWAGGIDVAPDYDLATDAQGNLEFEFHIPGLYPGMHHLTVEVNGGIVGVNFWVGSNDDRSADETPVEEVDEQLNSNFVRSFYYRCDTKTWDFYDPAAGDASTMDYFIAGSRYWILVKEQMEVILNRQTRNFTCRPDGNCWNFIVWY